MENSFGHINIDRKILKWQWYSDSKMLHLFIHLLLKANHKNGNFNGVEICRGQLISGRLKLATTLGFTENEIRTRLNNLQKSGEITIKTTNKFSIITICKYDSYQYSKYKNNQQEHQQITNNNTNKPPTNHQQATTNNNPIKNDNNEKENNNSETAYAAKKFEFENILNPSSFPNWRTECSAFLKDEYFKQQFCKSENLPMGNTEKLMSDFVIEQNLKNDFKNSAGLKKHFINHYKKHKQGYTSQSKSFVDVPEGYNYEEMETW